MREDHKFGASKTLRGLESGAPADGTPPPWKRPGWTCTVTEAEQHVEIVQQLGWRVDIHGPGDVNLLAVVLAGHYRTPEMAKEIAETIAENPDVLDDGALRFGNGVVDRRQAVAEAFPADEPAEATEAPPPPQQQAPAPDPTHDPHDPKIFRDFQGHPAPMLARELDGTRHLPDGKTWFSLAQAAEHFGMSKKDLHAMWYQVWRPAMPPPDPEPAVSEAEGEEEAALAESGDPGPRMLFRLAHGHLVPILSRVPGQSGWTRHRVADGVKVLTVEQAAGRTGLTEGQCRDLWLASFADLMDVPPEVAPGEQRHLGPLASRALQLARRIRDARADLCALVRDARAAGAHIPGGKLSWMRDATDGLREAAYNVGSNIFNVLDVFEQGRGRKGAEHA